jgi:stage II sporulation protein D
MGIAMAALMAPPSVFGNAISQAAVPPVPAPPANAIRVGLGRSQASAELSAPGGLQVVAGGAVQWQAGPDQAVKLTLVGGQIQVSGLGKTLPGPVRLVPVQPAPSAGTAPAPSPAPAPAPGTLLPAPANPVKYNRKPYRGEFEVLVVAATGKLSVVNVVNVDEYLLGVVPQEMPSGWHVEALKAQAVAARTYALRHVGEWAGEGFDLVDTTRDQAYGGLNAEKATTATAVAITRGQVLTYNGQLAGTYYHSSSGGHTENNEIIFNGPPVPYLRGVPDYDNQPGNSKFSWQFRYTPEEFAQKLAGANLGLGAVSQVQPSGAIGSSGRPSRWSLTGALSIGTMTAEQLRSALGLPSSVRTVTVKPAGLGNTAKTYQPGDGIYVVGADGTAQVRMVRGTTVVGASVATAAVATDAAVSAQGPVAEQAGGVEVAGGGYGHAVGMSQWGAYGMALQGKSYTEILTYYYQGTQVAAR